MEKLLCITSVNFRRSALLKHKKERKESVLQHVPLVSCGGETDSDSTHGGSHRALDQRRRVDPGCKSSSFEPSYWFSFSYRHLASHFTGLLGEQIWVTITTVCQGDICREKAQAVDIGANVFSLKGGLDNGESWELFCKHTEGLQSTLVIWNILCYSRIQLFLPDIW